MRVVKPIGKVPRNKLVIGLRVSAVQRSGYMVYFASENVVKRRKRVRLRKKNPREAIFIPRDPLPYGKAANRLLIAPVPVECMN